MPDNKKEVTGSVRRKVIFVFLCCCAALVLAWLTSRVAFREMLDTVDSISTPDVKLGLVSKVSRDIMQLDQLQRSQALLNSRASYQSFNTESAAISRSLDSLISHYHGNEVQIRRIDSIRTLLKRRDRLFDEYIKVRQKLVSGEGFAEQLSSLNSLIYLPAQDSTVVTTEKKISSSTTIAATKEEEDERGFLARVFGGRKKKQTPPEERQTIREEIQVTIDSIGRLRNDSAIAQIDSTMQEIRENQRRQSETFITREIELTLAGNALISTMLNILQIVENEAMKQLMADNEQARNVVSQNVMRLTIIILSFFFIISILIYLTLTDIRRSNANRKALEQAKEEAEYHGMAKQRFLSNMSHELRTPLQSIIGYTEQLRQEDNYDPEKVEIIHQSSEHLLQIVNEILDYNRITSGKIILNNQPFSIHQVLNEVIAVMRSHAEKKQLKLEQNRRIAGSGFVNGDAFRIRQLLFNLLSNAIKFTEAGSVTLNISSAVYGNRTQLNLVVKDTGPGIAPADIERIFNEFEQAENADSGVHFGSGLGLSIVKTICESMQGSVEVKSKPGYGAAFHTSLLLETAEETDNTALTTAADTPIVLLPSESTVWIVDDDRFILSLCQTILNKYHIRHRCFSSPNEVLTAKVPAGLHRILLDIRLPGKSGLELCKELRLKVPSDTGVIAFTAQVMPEEREKLLKQGFDGMLLKPFKESELLQAIGAQTTSAYGGKNTATQSVTEQIDLEKIRQLTYGDEQQLRRILNLYITDTNADLATLNNCFAHSDWENCALILHRMAGRTGLIGNNKLAFTLRKLEIDTRNGTPPSPETMSALTRDIESLLGFLKQENSIFVL